MTQLKYIDNKRDSLFFSELKKEVKSYFTDNNISHRANLKAKVKAFLLLAIYIFISIHIFFTSDLILYYLQFALLGALTIFTALNIGHDAAHNSFAKSKKANDILLLCFDFLGANGYLWKLKHVYSHHPHVNIPNMDGDIKQSNLVRIFPNSPLRKHHRFQHMYMPFLYLFYTFFWLIIRDIKDFIYPDISGKNNINHPKREWLLLFVSKLIFIFRMLILPMMLLSFSNLQIFGAFVLFHFVASATVAMALISTHVGEDSVYPQPDDETGNMNMTWVYHQISTTCDFATENPIITNLFGGFNHHTIHHLFPNICHIHYPGLTKILKNLSKKYDMPYQCNKTLIRAMVSHLKFLKKRSIYDF